MEKYDIYKDIAERTGGDLFVGVVGPVRTGKSTFITKFIDKMVLPNINNKLEKQITTDEMPQSGDGKTITTVQPKFIPANAVKVKFKNKSTANVKLIDCVGYLIDGVTGHEEDGKPRLFKTPWSKDEIPFEKAAEIGTKKVIEEYSTIGIVVTTDGSFNEIDRRNYITAEERVVNELKALKKPFVIVLNSKNPENAQTLKLAEDMEQKYGVSVICKDVLNLETEQISEIMEKVLLEFPMRSFNVDIPDWLRVLPAENKYVSEILNEVKEKSKGVAKMKDFSLLSECFSESENFEAISLLELKTGCGVSEYKVTAKPYTFYKALSEECGEEIDGERNLMGYIKSFSDSKRRFEKIRSALDEAQENGYGIVTPSLDEMELDEPVLIKQGKNYGIKLKATAPSLHILKVNVAAEVSPIVGTEKQGEEIVNDLMSKFENDPKNLWDTNVFGKSLHEMVSDELNEKVNNMPKNAQGKMRRTITRIVNENRGGVICILL